MSKFFDKVSKTLAIESCGVPIKFGDADFYVVRPGKQQYAALMAEAQDYAGKKLSDREKELKKKPLTKAEKDAIAELLKEALKANWVIKTQYDRDYYTLWLNRLGNLVLVESIRDPDGSKIYSDYKDRENIIEWILGVPGLPEQVQDAITESEKKRVAETTPQN